MPTYVLDRKTLIAEQWSEVIEHGAGKDTWVMDTVEKKIKEADLPGVMCLQAQVSMGGFFAKKHDLLRVTFDSLKEYRMFIGAQDFGAHLAVSWFLIIVPGFLKKTLSKRMLGSPEALSMHLPFFDQQELRVCLTVLHHCVTHTVETLFEELKQDTSGLNTR